MRRRRCALCPHKEYLHEDRRDPTGQCQVEDCADHAPHLFVAAGIDYQLPLLTVDLLTEARPA